MKRLLPVLIVGLAALSTPTARIAAQEKPSIAGIYACEGVNPDGNRYTCVLEVRQQGDLVQMRWTFPQGPPAAGVGLVRHGVLAVSYFGSGFVGVAVYKIDHGVISVGEWIAAGADGVYAETLTKMPDDHSPHPPLPQRDKPKPVAGTTSQSWEHNRTTLQPPLAVGAVGDTLNRGAAGVITPCQKGGKAPLET